MARRALKPCCVLAYLVFAACRAETIPVVECTSNADCAAGAWCSVEHACVTRVALVPDELGHVEAASNALGIEGFWRASADGYDDGGARRGTCQLQGGYPDAQCAVIAQPDPTLGTFPNQGGALCGSGTLKLVPWVNGDFDNAHKWGAEYVFDFAPGGDHSGVLDTELVGIAGISFEIDDAPPPPGVRVEFVAAGEDAPNGPPYWGAGIYLPPSPVRVGTNVVAFDEIRVPGAPKPMKPLAIDAIRFHFPASTERETPFSRCISGLTLLGQSDPALQASDASSTPPAILIDDFEDLDEYPLDRRFDYWQYYTFNPHEDSVHSVIDWRDAAAARDGNGGLNLEWSFADPPDGVFQATGVGLRTLISTTQVYLDVSQYTRLVFSHRYQHAVDDRVPDLGPNCLAAREFTVSFGCPEYGAGFEAWVPMSSEYTTTSLPFRLFTEAAWNYKGVAIEDCLKRVETWNFHMVLDLPDGQCGTGHWFLDNVSLR